MIMGHSKHKLSRKKKHVVLPKKNCHTTPLVFPITATTMATFFCPQGGRCGKVQLYFKFSGKPCRQTSKLWKMPQDYLK